MRTAFLLLVNMAGTLDGEVAILKSGGSFSQLVATSDGKSLVAVEKSGAIVQWNLTTFFEEGRTSIQRNLTPYRLHPVGKGNAVLAAARNVAAESSESHIVRVSVLNKSVEPVLKVVGSVQSFFRDETAAVLVRDQPTKVICHDLKDGATRSITMPGKKILQAEFTPDGRLLVVLNDTGVLIAWEHRSGKELWKVQGDKYIRRFFVLADGSKIVTANVPLISVWDAANGKKLVNEQFLVPRAIHPSGKYAVETEKDKLVFKSIVTGKRRAFLSYDSNRWPAEFVLFDAEGELTMAAGGPAGEIRVWSTPRLSEE